MRQVILSVAVLSAFAFGCGKELPTGGPPQGGPPVTPPGAAGGDTPVAEKPDVTMTAEEWQAESSKDLVGTLNKYAGKVVEIRGVVYFLAISLENELRLQFVCGDNPAPDNWILRDRTAWEKISPGSAVTIRAKLKPRGAKYPGLITADLVQFGSNPGPTITATELAKDYQANPNKAAATYEKQRWLYVEGVIDKVRDMSFSLVGQDGVPINCGFELSQWGALKQLKPGERVKVYGGFNEFFSRQGKAPSLGDCIFKVLP